MGGIGGCYQFRKDSGGEVAAGMAAHLGCVLLLLLIFGLINCRFPSSAVLGPGSSLEVGSCFIAR
jgi:hypothetical protein